MAFYLKSRHLKLSSDNFYLFINIIFCNSQCRISSFVNGHISAPKSVKFIQADNDNRLALIYGNLQFLSKNLNQH